VSDGRTSDALEYTLMVVDDEESIRITLGEALSDGRTTVHTAGTGGGALEILEREPVDLILLDQNLKVSGENGIEVLREIRRRFPDTLVIMMTAYGRIEAAVEATKLGCFQYITKPLEIPQLRLLIKSALATVDLRKEVEVLRSQQEREFDGERIFGSSEKMKDLLENVKKIARSGTSTILIRGDTGVGKDLIARVIHQTSPASKGPFVVLNCSAVPDNLLESELFGHEQGAFTDARRHKRGLLEMADRGTLFLDEIGEMPAGLQSKLLRVLETKTFRRLGSTNDIRVNVRFIAATNKDLFQEVEARRFREDLYYRLSVIPVYVPPLRERREDIGLLVQYFLDRYNQELGGRLARVADKAMEMLADYRWPGNVRELRNVVERLVLMHPGPEVLPEDLPEQVRLGAVTLRPDEESEEVVIRSKRVVPLAELEKAGIRDALAKLQGNKTRAAELLGISRQTLRTKVREYALETSDAEE
jgi:two-component system, NtrC family, response regulator AtoC